jgi:hypothetical protein
MQAPAEWRPSPANIGQPVCEELARFQRVRRMTQCGPSGTSSLCDTLTSRDQHTAALLQAVLGGFAEPKWLPAVDRRRGADGTPERVSLHTAAMPHG